MLRSRTSDVRLVAEHRAQRRVDIADFGDDLDVVLSVEQQPQARTDHGMVVGNDDPDRPHRPESKTHVCWDRVSGSDGETRNRVGRLERPLSTRGTADPGTDAELPEFARELAAENARLSRTLRTALEIGTAVASDTDLPRILELIVKRARALVDADGLLIWLRHGDQLRIAAVAGHADVPRDAAIPLGASTAGMALQAQRSLRVEDAQQMLISPSEFGMSQASSSLLVPLVHRGHGLGVLVAFDRLGATASFDADNERALEAFAASAATAVATARLVEEHRLHDSIAAAESERGRWARELHDETLQGLASLKLALAGALRGRSRASARGARVGCRSARARHRRAARDHRATCDPPPSTSSASSRRCARWSQRSPRPPGLTLASRSSSAARDCRQTSRRSPIASPRKR